MSKNYHQRNLNYYSRKSADILCKIIEYVNTELNVIKNLSPDGNLQNIKYQITINIWNTVPNLIFINLNELLLIYIKKILNIL